MIRDGTVPTISIEELHQILDRLSLEVVKTKNARTNLGYRPDYLLGLAINELILTKSGVNE